MKDIHDHSEMVENLGKSCLVNPNKVGFIPNKAVFFEFGSIWHFTFQEERI